MIHLYTGDGKGKTTAACGLALRMQGNGGFVGIIRFLKSGESGEITALSLLPGIRIFTLEKPHDFFYNLTDTQKETLQHEVTQEFALARTLVEERSVDLLVLDEIVDAVGLGLVKEAALLELLQCAEDTEIVLTGHTPSEQLVQAADYYTDFRAVKHPYTKGVQARRGIEY